MEARVVNLEDNTSKITVTVEAQAIDAKLKKVYRELAGKYNFPGFRKGKAPRAVIDNALGKETVLAQATEDIINDAYPEAVEDLRLFPVGSPDFGDPGMVEAGQDFTFEFTVGKKPEIELESYEPVEIELPSQGASEEEIEEQVKVLLSYHETYENAGADVAISPDNYADISTKASKDGEEIAALTSDSRFFAPGGGLFSEAFDDELMGMKKGETKEFTLAIPDDEDAVLLSDLAGEVVDFTVTCTVVKTKLEPELTDEWAKENYGFETAEALRADIEKSICEQKASVIPRIKENACALKLVERVTDEVPDAMAEEAESELLQDFFTQLQRQGMTFDAYLAARGIDSDQFKQDIKLQAQDEAKQQLALDAWARAKGIEASDEDVSLEFVNAGVDDPKKTELEWKKAGRLYLLREGIVRRKAMEDVIETAQVTEKDPAAQSAEEDVASAEATDAVSGEASSAASTNEDE